MATRKHSFYVINSKLQSEKKEEDRLPAYESIINQLTEKRRFVKVSKTEAVTMYPPFKREENNITYYYGSIGKGIYFEDDEIRVINDNGKRSYELNEKGRLINYDMNSYLYIPSIHRFALLKADGKVSLNDFLKFLQTEIPKIIDPKDKIIVEFERNSSIIDEVFKAKTVYSISYEISYTNNDALEAQGQLFDQVLKNAHVGTLKVDASADHNQDGLNLDEAVFLKGGLQLAKNNGTIKRAKIIPESSTKKQTLTNTTSPKIETFEAEENQNDNTVWFLKLLNLFEIGEI
jgi:hypothetical protein